MSENILIYYKGENQHSVSAGPKDLVRLNPGVNPVDAAVWDRVIKAAEKEAKANKGKRAGILFLMDKGLVTEAPAVSDDDVSDLSQMKANEAFEVIEAELDLDNLNKMLANEKADKDRTTVVAAIETQIGVLEAAYASGDE